MMVDYGWCSRRLGDNYAPDDHDGGFDHSRRDSCMNFVSDREHTRQMLVDAHEHDSLASFTYPNGAATAAGNYVREFVPDADASNQLFVKGADDA